MLVLSKQAFSFMLYVSLISIVLPNDETLLKYSKISEIPPILLVYTVIPANAHSTTTRLSY